MPNGPHLEDVIRALLESEGDLPQVVVTNLGQSGEYIRRLLDSGRYEKQIANIPGLDYVLIRYGLNDIFRREGFSENFPKDYQELISRLRADHPNATIVLMTVIPQGDENGVIPINELIKEIAQKEDLRLLDIYRRYVAELRRNPNMLSYRRLPLAHIPENKRIFVKPFVVAGNPDMVEVLDNRLDAHFAHLPSWFSDRHPNLAGYHVIADETALYLAPLLRARAAASTQPLPRTVRRGSTESTEESIRP